MLKKLLIVGAGVGLLSLLFVSRDASSYIGTATGKVKDAFKDAVSIEFEIDRARGMIKDLRPEIRKNMHLIAKEEVQVEKLERQVNQAESALADSRRDVLRLKSDLESSSTTFEYCGHSYSRGQVENDLANRFARFKTQDATVLNLKKILAAREQGLEAAREKLENMLAAKRQLEVDVENLEARLKMVQVAQTTSEFNFDDSQLARTKELIGDISTRIDVAERMVNSEGYFHDEIPLEETDSPHSTITQEVAEYFGDGSVLEVAANEGR